MDNSAGVGVRVLQRTDEKGLLDDLHLPCDRYGFGASWRPSHGNAVIDIDLQCVVVDDAGTIIDCAYYNNLKALRAITHSGDETAGNPTGIQELVWVNMRRLPANVSVLIFVVAAYCGGSLADVADGKLHVLEERENNEVAVIEMERSSGCVDVVAAMFKDGDSRWSLRLIDEPAEEGQHFMDVLDLLGTIIRRFLPNAPRRQKVAFAMDKGTVMDLPARLDSITVGLGWDVDEGKVDLDVTAVLFDASARMLEAVYFGRLESVEHGITHSGDNLTGEGGGDDEQIVVRLGSIGAVVLQVFFVVNIYTTGKCFTEVANPYCRIVDDASGSELCRYRLRDAGHEKGLIIAKLARESGRWAFHALGLPCRGQTYKDSLPQILDCFHLKTAEFRTQATNATLASGPALALPPPTPKSQATNATLASGPALALPPPTPKSQATNATLASGPALALPPPTPKSSACTLS
eukprot:TRINITY_DN3706_c0_g1_i1.p1 TRINITY_DN3706_c0_g1~~TRINITY_DN3706_c0_g1_i1.p1  ORF type:complete len:464 (-),score=83.09 TRINITY_DN3706_c0_g1_i1:39-1430(-)